MNKILKWFLICFLVLLGILFISFPKLKAAYSRMSATSSLMGILENVYGEDFTVDSCELLTVDGVSSYIYTLHSGCDIDALFVIDYNGSTLSKEQLGSYPLAIAKSKISFYVRQGVPKLKFCYDRCVSNGVRHLDLSVNNGYADNPVAFINSIKCPGGCDENRYYSDDGYYDSLLFFDIASKRGEVVSNVVSFFEDIGLNNYKVDIAFVDEGELSSFKMEALDTDNIHMSMPNMLKVKRRGDLLRVYMNNGMVFVSVADEQIPVEEYKGK